MDIQVIEKAVCKYLANDDLVDCIMARLVDKVPDALVETLQETLT